MKSFIIKITAICFLLTSTAFAWGWNDIKKAYAESEAPVLAGVSAQHILVKNAADAVAIKKELDNGGDFEYYARKYSICPSGRNGGYLGYFEHGQMIPEFEKKAFSMEVGEISNPIRTNYGWHIIRVVDKKYVEKY
ncbi:MAG: peptidylprolyl isomerase [Candidatus Gastranaerophilaceae bacterium]|nr:peptidylprolyl isomerase [Candidatus Gastranaerophilaceae bacterium]